MRPEAAAKEAAWGVALSGSAEWPMALASARGVWVPGQEALMGGYAERYFAEALPAIDGREEREEMARWVLAARAVARRADWPG